jgi:hypothetical protein
MPAANPITAIETNTHRRTRSYDIDWFRACAAFASFAENSLAALEGNQSGQAELPRCASGNELQLS